MNSTTQPTTWSTSCLPIDPRLATIVINNYNYSAYVADAIDSALAQTYPDLEVIVVDDGSTDNSRVQIDRYGNSIVAIYQENGGQASTFNAGLRRGRGVITCFLDADDMLLPETIAQAMRAVCERPETAKLQFRLEVVDARGMRTGDYTPPESVCLPTGDLRTWMLAFPDDVPAPPTSGNVFSTRVLRQIFPIPIEQYGSTLADLYLHNLVPLYGDVVSFDTIGGQYRVHGANLHHSESLDLERMRRVITLSVTGHEHIRRHACQLGLANVPKRADDILSVTYVANRLLSWRLERQAHPLPGDTHVSLMRDGIRAAARRIDLTWSRRALYALWFPVTAIAPRRCVRWLGNRALGFHPSQL